MTLKCKTCGHEEETHIQRYTNHESEKCCWKDCKCKKFIPSNSSGELPGSEIVHHSSGDNQSPQSKSPMHAGSEDTSSHGARRGDKLSGEVHHQVNSSGNKTLSFKIDRTFDLFTSGYVPTKQMKFRKQVQEDVKDFIKIICDFIEYNDDGYVDFIRQEAGEKLI
ncbi:hypothetical protein LCGC14_2688790 [marine sediment metagenome]|uniref:Uncharacterized protein n=1 Tax=marine sediment metagenome TaxID=412755 RepID=A0A0F8ZJ78_9ZZZZ